MSKGVGRGYNIIILLREVNEPTDQSYDGPILYTQGNIRTKMPVGRHPLPALKYDYYYIRPNKYKLLELTISAIENLMDNKKFFLKKYGNNGTK